MKKPFLLEATKLAQWIDQNRDQLQPPVGNKMVWEDDQFIVMMVGGPNVRQDFHIDPMAEIFLQLEGTMILKVHDEQGIHDITIGPGDLYCLPARVPHSPRRPEGSVGLVIEQKRKAGEQDGLCWFCEQCGEKLDEVFFQLNDIVKDLPPIFKHFYDDEARSTCKHCGLRAQDAQV